MKKLNIKKLIASLLVTTMALSFTGCGESASTSGKYSPGVYTSVTDGHNGEVKVDVTFDENSITKVEVKEHKESPGISDVPIASIPEKIVESQSLKIDTVSGATYTSNAILTAVADAVTQAGGDAEALKNVVVTEGDVKKDKIEKTSDVVVVGGGLAGLSAAVSAAEEGASVVLVEKNPFVGGNSIRTGGAYATADPEAIAAHKMNESQMKEIEMLINKETDNEIVKEWQEKVAKDIEEYKANGSIHMYDSVEFTSLQFYFRFGAAADAELLYDMVLNSKPMKDWLAGMGFPWVETPNLIIGDNWPRWFSSSTHKGGVGFIKTLQNEIEAKDYDVEIVLEVSAEELIEKDNKVVGVKGTKADGTPYQFNAGKGVVLATGGFAANTEMLEEYADGRWSDLSSLGTTNDPANVGDGIKMALGVDAALVDIGHLQILPIADPETGDIKTFIGSTTNMFVNKEGKRFVNETSDRDTLTNAILEQTDSAYYVVSSSDNDGIDKNGITIMGKKAEDLIKSGKVLKADTFEELAKKMGVDVDTFLKTVESFNKAVETRVDNEFGRPTFTGDVANPNGTPALLNAPFYACLRKPAAHITKGGIKVDLDAHVISEDGNSIEGLFAAGEVTGGRTVAGLLEGLTSGYRAGKSIMK